MKLQTLYMFLLVCVAGCSTTVNFPSGPVAVNSGTGMLIFVRETSPNVKELFRESMNGSNSSGIAINITDRGQVGSQEIRYPKFFPDGKLIYYIAKDNAQQNGNLADELVVARPNGRVVWKGMFTGSQPNKSACYDLKYPNLFWYNENSIFGSGLDFRVSAVCADDWANREIVSWTVTKLQISSGSPPPDVLEFGLGYEGKPTEITSISNEWTSSSNLGHTFETIYSHNGNLRWDQTKGAGHFIDECDDQIWAGVHTGAVYANHYLGQSSGGNPMFSSGPLRNAYAPSISADGNLVLFNSEQFRLDPNRQEELMVINTPTQPLCHAYDGPTINGIKYPIFKSTVTELTNQPGNEYASFAVDATHGFVMWRHQDPSNGGGSALYIASDTNSTPVRVHPGEVRNEFEGSWFTGS